MPKKKRKIPLGIKTKFSLRQIAFSQINSYNPWKLKNSHKFIIQKSHISSHFAFCNIYPPLLCSLAFIANLFKRCLLLFFSQQIPHFQKQCERLFVIIREERQRSAVFVFVPMLICYVLCCFAFLLMLVLGFFCLC
jgi:hypothetical protein